MADLRANVTSRNLCKLKKYQRLFHSLGMFGVLSSFRISFFWSAGKIVRRAANCAAATVENVCVDHGRFHVFVSEQLLNCADVVEKSRVESDTRCGGLG
jgi:hypothetical protein